MGGKNREDAKPIKTMIRLIEYGKDDERMYFSLIVIRLDRLQLDARSLIGIEITTGEALEGRGVVIDLAFVHIRFS